MLDSLFTNQCMAFVGGNGRALAGEALAAAEAALLNAQKSHYKIWSDRNGFLYWKERKLFASAQHLCDANGNPLKICGRPVNIKAKFCSRCGSPAPGAWWRCGNCGEHIGYESQACPHCGHVQHNENRLDIVNGVWQKGEDIFAERFEMEDMASQLAKGLNIQENQCAVLLEGGAIQSVLASGFYQTSELSGANGEKRSIVMVENSEFVLPVCVESLRTQDDIAANLHAVLTLQFEPDKAKNFMQNLMGGALFLHDNDFCSSLAYDEIAHCILQNTDATVREFCNNETVSELFKSADLRLRLEDCIRNSVKRNLDSVGLKFIRLQEVEFESEVFDKLRDMSGQVEAKRKEIEFMRRADELANDATRREAMSEFEMEDYMNQLAHEKGIKDELRVQELARMKKRWEHEQQKQEYSVQHDLADLNQERELARKLQAEEANEEIQSLHHKKELERRIAEQNSSLEFMQIETKVQELRTEIERKKAKAEQETAVEWLKIKQQKLSFEQNQRIELMKAASSADMKALLLTEDDPEKRAALLKLNEQEMQSKMTPELLLAAAAARGNAAAAEALSRLNKEQLEQVEKSKAENREVYEKMLQMNERMFNQAAESLAKASSGNSSNNTTQIIK